MDLSVWLCSFSRKGRVRRRRTRVSRATIAPCRGTPRRFGSPLFYSFCADGMATASGRPMTTQRTPDRSLPVNWPPVHRNPRRSSRAQAWALYADCLARAGAARIIPHGLDIQTDEQKLWFLGCRTFALRFDGDLNDILRRASSQPFYPPWRGQVKQHFEPLGMTSDGRAVPDRFD